MATQTFREDGEDPDTGKPGKQSAGLQSRNPANLTVGRLSRFNPIESAFYPLNPNNGIARGY